MGAVELDSLWTHHDDDDWLAVLPYGRHGIYKRGSVLFFQGDEADSFFYLKRGRVKISIYTEDGSEKILAVLDSNSLLGESSALLGQRHSGTAVVVSDAEVFEFKVADILRLMRSDPTIAFALIKSLVYKIRLLTLQVENLSFLDAPKRISRMLARVAKELGKPEADGTQITLRITHQELANISGSSRVTVTKVLKALRKEGIVDKDKWTIIVKDINKLTVWPGLDDRKTMTE